MSDISIPGNQNNINIGVQKTDPLKTEKKAKRQATTQDIKEGALEGAKFKGTFLAAEYMAAGLALGLGAKYKVFKFLPTAAVNAPKALGVSKFIIPSALTTATVAGVYGGSIGAAKGAADGLFVGLSSNKGLAMAAVAGTTALATLPAFKISRAVGLGVMAIGAGTGLLLGSHMYDKVKNEEP